MCLLRFVSQRGGGDKRGYKGDDDVTTLCSPVACFCCEFAQRRRVCFAAIGSDLPNVFDIYCLLGRLLACAQDKKQLTISKQNPLNRNDIFFGYRPSSISFSSAMLIQFRKPLCSIFQSRFGPVVKS